MTTTQKERKAEMQTASVYYGDCFKHLTHWNNWNRWDENNNARLKMDRKLADLIYLDPPWNSGKNYNHLYGDDDSQTAQESPTPICGSGTIKKSSNEWI